MDNKATILDWLKLDVTNACPLHYHFWGGTLIKPTGQPPLEALEKGLLLKDKDGITPLHAAAATGRIDLIPRKLLTRESLATANYDGETPVHFAATSGSLGQIPNEYLTKEVLTTKSEHNHTPLGNAIESGHLDQLIGLDLPDLSTTNIDGVNPALLQEWAERIKEIANQQEKLIEQESEATAIEIF